MSRVPCSSRKFSLINEEEEEESDEDDLRSNVISVKETKSSQVSPYF